MLDSAENSLKHRLSAYWWIVTTNGRAEVSNVRARWNGLQTQTLTLTADLASRTRLACTPLTLSTTRVPKNAPAEPTSVSPISAIAQITAGEGPPTACRTSSPVGAIAKFPNVPAATRCFLDGSRRLLPERCR